MQFLTLLDIIRFGFDEFDNVFSTYEPCIVHWTRGLAEDRDDNTPLLEDISSTKKKTSVMFMV